MAKAKLDTVLEATKGVYAGAGAADLAVGAVKEYVADVQKKVTAKVADVQRSVVSFELQPAVLSEQARTIVNARVEALAAEGKARRAAVEARVAELQGEARQLPLKVQARLTEGAATVVTTYAELAKRGELVVRRLRRDAAEGVRPSSPPVVPPVSKSAADSAATTSAARSTTKKAPATRSTAKKAPAKKAPAKKAPAKKTAPAETTAS